MCSSDSLKISYLLHFKIITIKKQLVKPYTDAVTVLQPGGTDFIATAWRSLGLFKPLKKPCSDRLQLLRDLLVTELDNLETNWSLVTLTGIGRRLVSDQSLTSRCFIIAADQSLTSP